MTRNGVYALRLRDAEFRRRWREAVNKSVDVLEEEARRRAVIGVEEPVFHRGEICGHVQKYSDTLLIFLLKGMRPKKYRDNWNGQLAIDAKMDVRATARQISAEDLDAAERQIALLRSKGVSLSLPQPSEVIEASDKEEEPEDATADIRER